MDKITKEEGWHVGAWLSTNGRRTQAWVRCMEEGLHGNVCVEMKNGCVAWKRDCMRMCVSNKRIGALYRRGAAWECVC
eukprot:94898-Chlamydomonas_euryale.AAC.5